MGTVDVDDDVQLIGELASGGLVNLSASRSYTGRGNYQRIEVSGRAGAPSTTTPARTPSPSASAAPGAPGRPGATSPRGASTA